MLRRTVASQLRAVVGVKHCIDYKLKAKVKDGKVVKDVKHSMNPFDEIAVEAAVQMKEKGIVKEIVAVTIGNAKSVDAVRQAMGIGADRGVHVLADQAATDSLETLQVAKIFAKLHEELQGDIYLLGKQAIDDDQCHVPQMLSTLLDVPQGTFAAGLELADDKSTLKVTREVDNGMQTLSMKLPAVVSCDLRLNTPRFATLPNIMKAKKKPLDTKKIADLGVDLTPQTETVSVTQPEERQGGGKVADVDELLQKLKTEAKVL
eukprot:TRINITY_DN59133_c0_g1_i1.p1 TRINITY_DN59133_c0_g1~~TRINITY_DN59133_c0_g1_i1.p1  ORF type:complete len:278 (+),score=146.85 TRINITY_DN59133_c0_g1_i1:51-836(+)